jgi:hypothetical protein
MHADANVLAWNGRPGHYEVYYLTLTDPATGVGAWIRYTMLAPLSSRDEPASASLWFLAMDPHSDGGSVFGVKQTVPIADLHAESDPFALRIGEATLSDGAMSGSVPGASWDLRWAPGRSYEHVHPALRAAKVAATILALPSADVALEGEICFGGRRLELSGARGGQAHLWGSKHADSWAWVHCNDFQTLEGEPVADTFLDGVSVYVKRLGRRVGPSTPVVGRVDGRDFRSTSPLRVVVNPSNFALTGWRFEAVDGPCKLVCEVDADRRQLAGVTYHDPDGERAYCYNTETGSMRMHVFERAKQLGGWAHRRTLLSAGHAHFEYAQRAPVPEIPLLTE